MTTFLDLKNTVYTAIARDSTDTAAALVVPKAINYAYDAAARLFKPPELEDEHEAVVLAGTDYKDFVLYRFSEITSVRDSTNSRPLYFIPLEVFDIIIPTLTVVRYYTVHGTRLRFNTSLGAAYTIAITYSRIPTELTNDANSLEFEGHTGFIVSLASAMALAVFEEGDSADMWTRMGEVFSLGNLKSARAREMMIGQPAIHEVGITGALAGITGSK